MLGTYIGSGPYWNEYLAKKHQPPPRMKQVIETHTPYEQFFHVTRLCTCATEHETRSMEARFIKKYNSTTGSNGYNTLIGVACALVEPGNPAAPERDDSGPAPREPIGAQPRSTAGTQRRGGARGVRGSVALKHWAVLCGMPV